MKLKVDLITIIIIGVALGIGLLSAHYSKKDDGQVEELAEKVIELESGLDIDLTPNSDEHKTD